MIRYVRAAAAVAATDIAAIVGLRGDAATTAQHLGHPVAWIRADGADGVLGQAAAAGLWLAAVWIAVGLLAANGARLPGALGRGSAALCRAVLPLAARRIVAGSAGLGVLIAPIAAHAAAHPASRPPTVAALVAAVDRGPLPSPAWPTLPAHRPHQGRHGAADAPASQLAARTVRVAPGDCLWLLAAHRLGDRATDSAVAAYWPRWYAANRRVIGSDPDELHPGERLAVPPLPSTVHVSGGTS